MNVFTTKITDHLNGAFSNFYGSGAREIRDPRMADEARLGELASEITRGLVPTRLACLRPEDATPATSSDRSVWVHIPISGDSASLKFRGDMGQPFHFITEEGSNGTLRVLVPGNSEAELKLNIGEIKRLLLNGIADRDSSVEKWVAAYTSRVEGELRKEFHRRTEEQKMLDRLSKP